MTDWYKIKRVLIWQNNQEKQIYPATWNPWANTVAYYPLTDDFNDHKWSWTLYNLTNNGWSLTTLSWVKCAYYNWSSYSSNSSISFWSTRTLLAWCYLLWNWMIAYTGTYNSSRYNLLALFSNNSWKLNVSDLQVTWFNTSSTYLNQWVLLAWIVDGQSTSTMKMYINWSLYNESSRNYWSTDTSWLWVWRKYDINSDYLTWYISNLIIENKAWTAQEVLDYYNQTKSQYGL